MDEIIQNSKKRKLYFPVITDQVVTNDHCNRGERDIIHGNRGERDLILGNRGERDRLSSLPNFILGKFLSRLPLDTAAATSVLSRRWRGLWSRYTTRLSLDFYKFPPRHLFSVYRGTNRSFLTTVDHILRQVVSSRIDSFSLRINYPSEDDERKVCTSSLESWLHQICTRNAKEIKVKVDFESYKPLIPLPTCVFECESLTKLVLRGSLFCKLPENRLVTLPNLKELDIFLPGLAMEVITTIITLIKSCPLLESLSLALKLLVDVFIMEICAPNLKHLSADITGTSTSSMFVIVAPRLKTLTIDSDLACYSFLNHPGRLQNAKINIRNRSNTTFQGRTNDPSSLFGLVRGISSISFLGLSDNLNIFNSFRAMDAKLRPIFHNLTELSLTEASRGAGNERAPIPVCLLRKLKYVEIMELEGDGSDIKLIKYILSYANVLEKLYLTVQNLDDYVSDNGEKDQLWREYIFCRELFKLPMRSWTCVIEFEGTYITKATSKEFEDGPSILNYFGRELSGGVDDVCQL